MEIQVVKFLQTNKKAFDTVDHQILLANLNHYEIRGVSNNRFKSYISIHNQYISRNGYESGLHAISCGIPQGSDFPAGIYLFKVNKRNTKTRCEICSKLKIKTPERGHWRLGNAIKKLNKLINADLKHLVNCLNANKISVNVKTKKKLKW